MRSDDYLIEEILELLLRSGNNLEHNQAKRQGWDSYINNLIAQSKDASGTRINLSIGGDLPMNHWAKM